MLQQQNKEGHTPMMLAEKFDESNVVAELCGKEILTPAQYEHSKKNAA
jgi:hypothetical protein